MVNYLHDYNVDFQNYYIWLSQAFDYAHSWWRLLQKHVVFTNVHIFALS